MKKNIIIAAAPFGYGPASKALLIANSLADVARITLFSRGDARRMLERHCKPGIECKAGVFSETYPSAADLAAFDAFICVNNDFAVQHLIAHGCAARTLFVDSLQQWRKAFGGTRFPSEIRAYVVQDFPGAVAEPGVLMTAPLVWTPGTRNSEKPGNGVLTHLGGLTSPVVSWTAMRRTAQALLEGLLREAERLARPLTVIGSRHLEEFRFSYGSRVELRPEASPQEAARLISEAALVATTPGIGVLYEAMASQVPILLLPPTNSTQLHSYKVLTRLGFAHTANEEIHAALGRSPTFKVGNMGPWLERHIAGALGELPRKVESLLGSAGRQRQLLAQSTVQQSLSRQDPLEVIGRLALT